MLIYNNEYYGHIYTWTIESKYRYSFAIGIRDRVENIFLRQCKISPSNMLLE